MYIEPELSRRAWAPGIVLMLLFSNTGCGPEAQIHPLEEATQDQAHLTAFARPNFLAPFPCGQSWTYSHHSAEVRRALDFVKNDGGTDGQPNLASADGYATTHYQANGAGNYVKIDHGGGWMTYHFHLKSFSVANGTQVRQGQEIGRTGSTGASSGPHIHYEQLLNGVGQDIVIDGVSLAPYPSSYGYKSITSTNCGTPPPPWYNVFIQGTDNAIWSRHWNGTAWHAWESLGGVLGTAPTSAKMSADTVHVYAVGTNGVLYQKWWNGSTWSGWESLGGVLHLSRPAAASMGPGDMHVFARGTDNQLYQRWWSGTGWVAWENLGGNLASGPAAVSKEPGTLNLFARGPTGNLIHKYWTGTAWSIWEDLGGQITSAPAVVSISRGTMHIFAKGTDNAIWMRRWTGTAYSNWETIGGQALGDPWAVSPAPGTMHIFTKATDGAVWQKTWTNNAWIDWRSIGGNPK